MRLSQFVPEFERRSAIALVFVLSFCTYLAFYPSYKRSEKLSSRKSGWRLDPFTKCNVWVEGASPLVYPRWYGTCENGLAEGSGKAQFKLLNISEIPNEQDTLVMEYQGRYSKGKKNGKGTERRFRNNELLSEYSGLFKDDQPNGNGTLVSPSRFTCKGHFVNGVLNGSAECIFKDGKTLAGSWEGGKYVSESQEGVSKTEI